jgi:hypothetical protein
VIDLLLTYLPASRLSDISNFFKRNVAALKPYREIVYLDGTCSTGFETRCGEWHDRTLCLMDIFLDLKKENFQVAYIVDSDNIVTAELQDIDSQLGLSYYSVLDETCPNENLAYFERRSDYRGLSNDDPFPMAYFQMYKTVWKSPFFVGPKQGMRFSKSFIDSLDTDMIWAIKRAMEKIDPTKRNFVSDEQSLAMLFYYSGYYEMPWVIHGKHLHGPRNEHPNYQLLARTHADFAGELIKQKFRKELFWYYLRNRVAQFYRTVSN